MFATVFTVSLYPCDKYVKYRRYFKVPRTFMDIVEMNLNLFCSPLHISSSWGFNYSFKDDCSSYKNRFQHKTSLHFFKTFKKYTPIFLNTRITSIWRIALKTIIIFIPRINYLIGFENYHHFHSKNQLFNWLWKPSSFSFQESIV